MKLNAFSVWFLMHIAFFASAARHVHLDVHKIQPARTQPNEQFLALKILKILNDTINNTNAAKDPEWDGDSIQANKTYDKDYPDDRRPQPGPDLEAEAEKKVQM